MKKLVALLILILVAVVVLAGITNPGLFEKAWLFVLGFIGYVVVLVEKGFRHLANAFSSESTSQAGPKPPEVQTITELPPVAPLPEQQLKMISDTLQREAKQLYSATITVLRYLDDGQTTLGLLFLDNRFFAYTLEDTYREVKIPKQTRIPAGFYQVGFSPVDPSQSSITQKYRRDYPWFDRHIHIRQVPDFQGIYIHIGNTHVHTDGCILVADGVNTHQEKAISHSRIAFERFYKEVARRLTAGEKITIQLYDEHWFEKCQIPSP